eukprot:7475551-Lingulodinium_polyedra.AAC.1
MSLIGDISMYGAVLARNDWFEVVHGAFDATKWTGDHYIVHLTPLGDPSGAVYRTGDLKRPEHIDH